MRISLTFHGVDENTFARAMDKCEREVRAVINKALKEARMGKKPADVDLSDILGDVDTPSTQGAKRMATKEKAPAKKSAKAAPPKPATPAKAAAKPAKATAKPAKKGNGNAERSSKGSGAYYFPSDSKEFETLKATVKKAVKKPISTKELAAQLKTETWRIRAVSVALEAEKAIKRSKDGNTFMLAPR